MQAGDARAPGAGGTAMLSNERREDGAPSAADRPSASPRASSAQSWAVAGGLLAVLLFAGNFLLGRRAAAVGISPYDLVTLRFLLAGLCFLPFAWRRWRPLATFGGIGLGRGLLLAALGGVPYFLAIAAAMVFAPAGHGAVLNPGAVSLGAIALAWFAGDRLGPFSVVGVPMMLAGLLLVGGDGLAGRADAPQAWIGDILLLLSGLGWATYGLLMRRWRIDAVSATTLISVVSLLAWVLPWFVLTGGATLAPVPWQELLLQALYLGLAAGGVAVVLYSRAIILLGVARAALFPPLVPLIGVSLAALLLGEPVTAWQLAGMAVTVAGMLLAALPRRRPRGDGPRQPRTLSRSGTPSARSPR